MPVRIRIRWTPMSLAFKNPAPTQPAALLAAAGLVAAVLAVLLAPLPAPAEPSPAALIAEWQRAGRIDEALDLCRQENAAHPGDADMLYNQACLENRAGHADAAIACLRAALAAGFDDLAFAEADPDLQGAAKDGARAAIAEHRQQRRELSARLGAKLAVGRPATLALAAPGGGEGATLTLTWVASGLDLRLEADDTGARYLPADGAAPWAGKGGLLVALGDLQAKDARTNDALVFGFGTEKGNGVGSMFVVETGRWQRVRELQPKFRGAGTNRLVMDASISWEAIRPFHPLVDGALGIDVTLVTGDGKPGPGLMGQRLWEHPDLAQRAAARLDFDLASAPAGVLQGRTPTTVVTGRSLALNLAATADAAGDARLTIDFRDGQGNSLLAEGAEDETVSLVRGLNAINRAVDFGKVHGGPCRIAASLEFPSGLRSEWSIWVLNLGPEWESSYRATIATLPAEERPTARYYLAAIADAVRAHRPRRDPGAMTTTLGDLNLMLSRFKQTGSLVPAEGSTPFVYTGPGGSDRLCLLVVPSGRPADSRLTPIVLAGHTKDDAPRLAARILRFLERGDSGQAAGAEASATPPAGSVPAGTWPVYVVAAGEDPGHDAPPLAELRACLQWAGQRFASDKIALVAQRGAVAPALALTRDRDVRIGRLLLIADETLAPWPNATTAELDRRVGPPPAGLDLTWIEFAQETTLGGQGRALREALRRQGWAARDIAVRGGANYTQVADRACLWQARAGTTGAAGR